MTLNVTSVGHHCISLLPEKIADVNNVADFDLMTFEDKYKTILKLHRQYGHPGKHIFMKHLKSEDMWDDECESAVTIIYDDCNICKQYAKAPPRPKV